jgi:GxxExxY protein
MTRQEYKDIYDVIGAAMEVYNTLGRGMAEPVYQEALAIEMSQRGMTAEREKPLKLHYKNTLMEKTYYADFYYKGIIIEMKSV